MSDSALWPALLPHDRHGSADIRVQRSAGTRITFASGRSVLCGTSGLWNVNLGYGNEVIAEAIARAAHDASYLSVFRYENTYAREAADALLSVVAMPSMARIILSTSGAAANDLSMKLARQYQALACGPHRNIVVSLDGSFHGLTYGAFSLTGEDLGQDVYGVDRRLIRHVPPNDGDALRELMRRQGNRVAAMVVEPVLGTGAIELTDDYLDVIGEMRAQYGFLLVADEVATGFWRTGTYFASQRWPVAPDLLISSKGLTNGAAAGAAVVVSSAVDRLFADTGTIFAHGETQAGTPTTCAAISATIDEVDRLDIPTRAPALGRLLEETLRTAVTEHPQVHATCGVGAFRALTISDPATGQPLAPERVGELVAAIRDEGAIVHPGLNGIQLIPALIYDVDDVEELMACVYRGIDRLFTPRTAPA